MFTSTTEYTYTITIPLNTSKDVVEWFEIMESSNQLSEALIELVHSGIKSGECRSADTCSAIFPTEKPEFEDRQAILQGNFMEGLYNWQDSASAIFKEANAEKKGKKKMLSV